MLPQLSETKPIQPLNLLTGIRELLTDPKRWTKGSRAQNNKGFPVFINSSEAVCFCLFGAAIKTAGLDDRVDNTWPVRVILDTEFQAFAGYERQAWGWNDDAERTHADILKFLDTRIEFHLANQSKA
jgi:hypothetical protein